MYVHNLFSNKNENTMYKSRCTKGFVPGQYSIIYLMKQMLCKLRNALHWLVIVKNVLHMAKYKEAVSQSVTLFHG